MKNNNNTIIFVPGFKGSTLVNQEGTLIWPNLIRAQFNHTTSLSNDPASTNIQHYFLYESADIVKTVTVLPGLYKRNIYSNFVNSIKKNISVDTELILFHYDWRQDLMILVNKLKSLIETISKNKEGKIDIICHSMGGLITNYVMQTIRNDRIRQVFFVAVPFRGTAKALLDLMYGSKFGMNHTLLSAKTMASFLSIYYLLPRYPEALVNHDLFDIETWKELDLEYLSNQDSAPQFELLKIQLARVNEFYNRLESEKIKSCEQKKLIFINSLGYSTPTKIQLKPKINIISSAGDGSIPGISLQVPDYFRSFDCKVYHIDKRHVSIFTSNELIKIILKNLVHN